MARSMPGDLRAWILACGLMLAGLVPPDVGLTAEAKTPDPKAAQPTEDTASLLQGWDDTQRLVQRGTWGTYAWTSAFGKDERGRTAADDVDEWVMTRAVREQLRSLRQQAELQIRKHDEKSARETLTRGKNILEDEQRRIAVIFVYWEQRGYLQRDRALWLRAVDQVPAEMATASKTRIGALESDLTRQLSPELKLESLNDQISVLKEAYNGERLRLAAVASDRETAAGHIIEHRIRDMPCPTLEPTPSASPTGGASTTPTAAHLISTPPPGSFYPDEARRGNIAGRVILKAAINADGCMTSGDIVRSSGAPEIDAAALDLAERSTWAPGRQNGRPIASQPQVVFKFELSGSQTGTSPSDESVTKETHTQQAWSLFSKGDYGGAITELSLALQVDPTNVWALATRGLAHAWRREAQLAREDLDAAAMLDSRDYIVFQGRGLLALQAGNLDEATSQFTHVLEVKSHDQFALARRAETYLRRGDPAKALADVSEALDDKPDQTGLYAQRAFILRALHQPDKALAQATAVTAAAPTKSAAWLVAAVIYEWSADRAQAAQAVDKAIALEPTERAYLARARYRAHTDFAARRADFEAALKLNPHSVQAILGLAQVQSDAGDYAEAITTATQGLAANPGNVALLVRRAIAYLKSRQTTQAEADLNAAREKATSAADLNTLCWDLAVFNVELSRALSACDASLALDPLVSAHLDSRGLALLRMERYAESLAAYNDALKARPLSADSLYGRSLARKALGDERGSEADLQMALALDAGVVDDFAIYGVGSH